MLEMLKNLFRRAAVADPDNVTYVGGATGTGPWRDGKGADVENYHLEKDDRTSQWNLVHAFGGTNRDMDGTTTARIPKLADAAVILRGVIEQDLKSHYAGIANGLNGRPYAESRGVYGDWGDFARLSIVERTLNHELS